MAILDYFTDPVLRAPTIGCMLMCLASSLVGILVFVRKRSLLGEALSHASYPGVVISVIVMASFFPFSEEALGVGILIGAFCSALIGLYTIDLLERRWKIKNDAALCLVLSIFFGFGLLLASRIQTTHTLWYKQIQLFLFGQAATMTDRHIYLYALLASFVVLVLALLYRFIETLYFDRDYAKAAMMPIRLIESLLFALLTLSIVIGIRSVGVVLMSAMLIAPVVTARQFTHNFKKLFFLSGLFGVLAGFLGNVFSLKLGQNFPTGPMIVLSSSSFCLVAFFLSPRGLFSRLVRHLKFKERCLQENILKGMWREQKEMDRDTLKKKQGLSTFFLSWLLWKLKRGGFLVGAHAYKLTEAGQKRGAYIVRLHRLWEAYLVYMGQGQEKVHKSAEEMEHILTPEMEQELTALLRHPTKDPHEQPIP